MIDETVASRANPGKIRDERTSVVYLPVVRRRILTAPIELPHFSQNIVTGQLYATRKPPNSEPPLNKVCVEGSESRAGFMRRGALSMLAK